MIRRLRRLGGASLILLLWCWGATAQEALLTAQDTLRIEFITTPPFIEHNPNVLYGFLGYTNRLAPYRTIRGYLYDGDVLLGVSTSSNSDCGIGIRSQYPAPPTWKSPGSPWNFPYPGDPAVVDFTSIHHGSIVGRIEYEIDAGSFAFDFGDVALRFVHATGPNYGESIPPSPLVTSISIVPRVHPLPAVLECGSTPPPVPPPPSPPPASPPPPAPGQTPPPAVVIDDDDITLTTADLRNACEQSQGNTVVMNHSVTISNGSPAQEYINSDCTLVLGSDVTLEVDRASLTFAGPLTVQSKSKAAVKLNHSMFSAPFMTFNLPGTGSAVMASDSTLHAADGSLAIALGQDGKVEFVRQRSGQVHALTAAHTVRITSGQKFLGLLGDTSVNAPLGFRLDINGTEGALKVDESTFLVSQGSFEINAASTKSLVEMNNTDILVRDALAMRLVGSESTMKLTKVELGPFSGATAGAVTLEAGIANAPLGKVEGSEVHISGVASVAILASRTGTGGLLKLEKSVLSATGNVSLESRGTTEVKENDVTSATRIRIAAGPSGSCVAEPNVFLAPILELCP